MDIIFKVKRSEVKITGSVGILWRPPIQLVYLLAPAGTKVSTVE